MTPDLSNYSDDDLAFELANRIRVRNEAETIKYTPTLNERRKAIEQGWGFFDGLVERAGDKIGPFAIGEHLYWQKWLDDFRRNAQ